MRGVTVPVYGITCPVPTIPALISVMEIRRSRGIEPFISVPIYSAPY